MVVQDARTLLTWEPAGPLRHVMRSAGLGAGWAGIPPLRESLGMGSEVNL
jgi:hypothetical protein